MSNLLRNLTLSLFKPNIVSCRSLTATNNLLKKTTNKIQSESESSEDPDHDDHIPDKNSKIIDSKLSNLRVDSVLKSGLGMARNKIEVIFYESKIRINGEKVLKKSEPVHEGDEIDVIKGLSSENPSFLTVARVEVLSTKPKEDYISVKLRRWKTLLVENYPNAKWKPSSAESNVN